MLDLLGFHRDTRAGNAHVEADRQPQFGRARIQREHVFVVDRHLRKRAAGEHADRRQAHFGVDALDPAHFINALVGIARQVEEKPVAVSFPGAARCGVVIPADQRLGDVEAVHLIDRPLDEIVHRAGPRHILEHVLRGHAETVERLPILDQRAETVEPIGPVLRFGDAEHAVDHADVGWHGHRHETPFNCGHAARKLILSTLPTALRGSVSFEKATRAGAL